jgi:hypothetical protein
MAFTIEWNGQGFVKRFTGYITEHEFLESADATVSHPSFYKARYVINDFTNTLGQRLTPLAIAYAELVEARSIEHIHKVYILYVSSDPEVVQFVKQIKGASSHNQWQAIFFYTLADALTWISDQQDFLDTQKHRQSLNELERIR